MAPFARLSLAFRWRAGGHRLTFDRRRSGAGSAGDIVMQAMFPLHSGRIIGIAGRILMSLMGVAVATLSVTGVLIWMRKRRAAMTAAGRIAGRPGCRQAGLP